MRKKLFFVGFILALFMGAGVSYSGLFYHHDNLALNAVHTHDSSGQAVLGSRHSGGTDRYGCHHDRKRGGYHCH